MVEDDVVDLSKGMALLILYCNGESKIALFDGIADSEKIVKIVKAGEILWGKFKEEKTRSLRGRRFKNIKSAMFVPIQDQEFRGWWHIVNENECERTWIETGIDSSTYRVVFRIEYKENNEIIVYRFMP